MALDLKELERKLDNALAKETKKSINAWLKSIRKRKTTSSKIH